MAYEVRTAKIDRFAGWSDRAHPSGITRIENPTLLNADFSEDKPHRRYGFVRLNSEPLRDGSIRLDGVNDYLQFRHLTSYAPTFATDGVYLGIGVVLHKIPASTVTLVSKGFGSTTNRFLKIIYDPTGGGGGVGTWKIQMYDPTATTLVSIKLDDGDSGHVPEGLYRYLEMYTDNVSGTRKLQAKLYKEDGTTVTASAATITSYVASTEDLTVGVSMSASATIGTDFSNVSVCELRYYVGALTNISRCLASVTTYNTTNRFRRELMPDEYQFFLGYWKLNDGNGTGVLVDLGTGDSNGTIPANPAAWVQVDGQTIGQSGIQFFGHDAFAALWCIASVGTTANILTNPFDTTTTGQVQRWTVRGIFVPKLATGESAVRDQTIFWAGTNATIPAPVGLRIISNAWVATYRDQATTRTVTISTPTPTTLVNKQVRWAVSRFGATNGTLRIALTYVDNSGVQQQTFTDLALASGGTPDTMNGLWFIGRHVTSAGLPYTYGTSAGDGGAYGIIDDFQVVWTNSTTVNPVSHGGPQAFQEIASWGSPHTVVAHLKMNEGAGNYLNVTGQTPPGVPLISFLNPEQNDGAHWDVGLVRPYRPPECGGLFEYDFFQNDGSIKRTKLVNSGCTWYTFDTATGIATPIGAAPRAATRWTKDQYAQVAILAADNGHRPLRYDGTGLDNLGIAAPLAAPVLTDAATGTFTGTYYFYCTFYNRTRDVESNPGPGVSYTLSSRKITAVTLPLSADPQVTTRRLYVTLANGADGSLAFLLKEFDDNTQVAWGAATTPFTLSAITAPATSGRELEYFERQEAPITSIAKVFGDNLFLAGDPVFPTRVYRSDVGTIDYFNQDDKNVDFDLDSGDPVTGMKPLVDALFVGLRDGWGMASNTGNSNNPISRVILSRDHGPVGPHCMIPVDREVYYLSERDIFVTDGRTEQNVTSPPRADLPSIQHAMKTRINPARRGQIVGTDYKSRKQLMFAYSSGTSTRNDRMIVYDRSKGTFSDYELGMDFITELEDDNDDPTLYGVSEGYVCKLDQADETDGADPTRIVVDSFTAGTCPYITYSGSAVSGAQGLIAFCYKRSTAEVLVARCEYSETNKLRFYSQTLGLGAGDVVIVAGIRFDLDYVLDFGESIMAKRLRALYVSGKSNDANTRLRVQWAPHQAERSVSLTTADQSIKEWPVATDMLRFEMGGKFRTVRIRITESDDAKDIFSTDPWVSTVMSPPVIYEIAAKAEVMDVE